MILEVCPNLNDSVILWQSSDKGLDHSRKLWFSNWGWGKREHLSERTDDEVGSIAVTHRGISHFLFTKKRGKKRWRELCFLLPDIITNSKTWKQTQTVTWHMIKALHIHHCGKKMYPKNSLVVTESSCVSTKVTVRVSLMTVHLLIISQQADSYASFPVQSSLSPLLNRVNLPSPCTLNQFYDFIFMATSLCFEEEHLLTRDSVVFKVIYFMRVLK